MSNNANNFMVEARKLSHSFEGADLEIKPVKNSNVAKCHKITDGNYYQEFGGTLVMTCPANWSPEDAASAHWIAKKAYREGYEAGRRSLGEDIADLLGVATKEQDND